MSRTTTSTIIGVAASILLGSGCSPGTFFGKGYDNDVVRKPGYRRINPDCAVDLSSRNLDPKSFKSLLHCFNSYGALAPIEKLVDKLEPEELDSLLAVINEQTLRNPRFIHELEASYLALHREGKVEPALEAAGALAGGDLAADVISLLASAEPATRDRLIRALPVLADRLTPENAGIGLDGALSVAGSRAWESLTRKLAPAKDEDADSVAESLKPLAEAYFEHVSLLKPNQGFHLLTELSAHLSGGYLFPALDKLVGTDEAGFRASVPRLSMGFGTVFGGDGSLFVGVHTLMAGLEDQIRCFKGAADVPYPSMRMLRTLAELREPPGPFLERTHLLDLVALRSFCSIPEVLEKSYGSIVALAETPAIDPSVDVIRAFFEVSRQDPVPGKRGATRTVRPLARFLISMLSDDGLSKLIPLMTELSARDAWTDLVLLSALPPAESRANVADTLHFLTSARPELDGRSMDDLVDELVTEAGASKLLRIAIDLHAKLAAPRAILAPAVAGARDLFGGPAVHPLLALARAAMTGAPQPRYRPFYESIFRLSDTAEFRDSIELLSTMARDGRARELLAATIALTHGIGAADSEKIPASNVTPFKPSRRHDLNADDLRGGPVLAGGSTQPPACRIIDLDTGLDQEQQWLKFAACLKANGGYEDVQEAIEYLRSQKTDSGQSYLSLDIHLVEAMKFTRDELAYFIDRWKHAYDDGAFNRGLRTASLWIRKKVIRPALDLIEPVLDRAYSDLRALEELGAATLRRADFPAILRFTDHALRKDRIAEASRDVLPAGIDESRVMRWIGNKECSLLPGNSAGNLAMEKTRAQQIFQNYSDARSSWEAPAIANRSWTLAEARTRFEPLLDRVADTDTRRALLELLADFSLKPGERASSRARFTAEDLVRWYADRSSDAKLMTYFYPGDEQPEVRLATTLDRFELILINSDFNTMDVVFDAFEKRFTPILGSPFHELISTLRENVGTNFGKKFMDDLASSWGDEPFDTWPEEFQRRGSAPTLRQTVEKIVATQTILEMLIGMPDLPQCTQIVDGRDSEDVRKAELWNPSAQCVPTAGLALGLPTVAHLMPACIGLPGLPDELGDIDLREIKRRLFNIRQVLSSMVENLPDAANPRAGGMRVLRDLFYAFRKNTPADGRSPLAGDRNLLSVITQLAKLGVNTEIEQRLRRTTPSELPAVFDAYRTLIDASLTPEADHVLEKMADRDGGREVVWNAVGRVFSLAERGDAGLNARMRQTALYTLANASRLGIVAPTLKTVSAIVDERLDFLSRHVDALDSLLESQDASNLGKGMYDSKDALGRSSTGAWLGELLSEPQNALHAVSVAASVADDSKAHRHWREFVTRWDDVMASSAYRNLKGGQISREILDFLENRERDSRAPESSRKARGYLADRLDRGDADELLKLAARDPDRFEKLLDTLAKYIDNGDIEGFLDYARESLKNPER